MSTIALTETRTESALGQLARLEIRRYLRHPLYLLGSLFLALSTLAMISSASRDNSPLSAPIAPAFLMGVFGIVIAAQLTRSAHQIGRAAGAAPVPERTRTLALAISFVVPVLTAAIWIVVFLVIYRINPPTEVAWWFGRLSTPEVLSVLAGTGVVASFGGPALGMLVARWVSWRAAPLVMAVLLVVACMLTQAGPAFPRQLGLLMPWTAWAAGVTDHKSVYNGGAPVWWLVYAVALCALAVVTATYRDPDADPRRYRMVAGGIVLVAVAAVVLAITTGAQHTRYIPVPPGAASSSAT